MKKKVRKKSDSGNASYVLGIVSIVLAFFTPLAGLIFGIIGMNIGKNTSSPIAQRGVKLSKIGLIISIIMLVIVVAVPLLFGSSGIVDTFPVQ